MTLLIEQCNHFTLETLQELHDKCNVEFVVNDGRIVGIGHRFG